MKKFIKKLLGIDKLEAELEKQKDINIRLFAIATSEKIDHQTAVRLFVHDKKDLDIIYLSFSLCLLARKLPVQLYLSARDLLRLHYNHKNSMLHHNQRYSSSY